MRPLIGMIGGHSLGQKLLARGDDVYETPPEAVRALVKVEKLPSGIWEPACGPGSIVRELRAAGHVVYATDLVDHRSKDQDCSRWDFLFESQMPIGAMAIVTNPPFKLATEFVEHALKLGCPLICMLLRVLFLESERRSRILDTGLLSRVHVFRSRLPMMHRDGWNGPRIKSGAISFAWFVWDQKTAGAPTIIDRISWAEGASP